MEGTVRAMSDQELVDNLRRLNKREIVITAEILLHLLELGRRQLYRELGYSSLYGYCVGALKYSPSAAKRRLTAVKCISEYPEIYRMFLKKELSLSTISIIAPVLTQDNKTQLLGQVINKSPIEVEWIVAWYNPKRPIPDRIRPMVVRSFAETNSMDIPALLITERIDSGSREPKLNSQEQLQLEERYRIEFSASKEFRDKLERMKELLVPGTNLEGIFERLMDEYLDRNSPERREARRITRQERKTRANQDESKPRESTKLSRRKRDQVFLRDGFSCTYVSPDRVRCNAKTGLHIDHIQPRALGGLHSLENLRLLCGPHNRLAAETELGTKFMAQFY